MPEVPDADDLEDVQRVYVESGGSFVVGELDETVVAMGEAEPVSDTTIEIRRMCVDPAYQRRGFGRAVLDALETAAVDAGFTSAELETTTMQPAALGFYRSHGYEEVGRDDRADFEVVAFEKRLDSR